MKFKRTSDFLKDTEILKGTAASDAPIDWLGGDSNPDRVFASPQLSCKVHRSCQSATYRLKSSEDGGALWPKGIPAVISWEKEKRWLAVFYKVSFFPPPYTESLVNSENFHTY